MELEEIESSWNNLVQQEYDLQKQLKENKGARNKFCKEAWSKGFCWEVCKWVKIEDSTERGRE